jgi:hypothetical protein
MTNDRSTTLFPTDSLTFLLTINEINGKKDA